MTASDTESVTVVDPRDDVAARPVPPAADGRVSPVVALRRHWLVSALLVVALAAAGVGVAAALPSTVTAESRLAVGSTDLSALSVPGYAAGAEQVAANTARYLGDAQALGQMQELLGDAAEDVTDVSASPIPDSSIIRVEVSASTQDAAVDGAQAVTDELVARSQAINRDQSPDAVLEDYTAVSRELAEVEAQVQETTGTTSAAVGAGIVITDEARAALVDLTTRSDVLTARQEALQAQYQEAVSRADDALRLSPVGGATLVGDDAAASAERLGLVGAVLGGLLGLVVSVLLERRRGGSPRAR